MAAVCDVCGKTPGFGHNVSHSHRRTKRRFNPNIQRLPEGRTDLTLAELEERPTIFTALREQFGLRLEPATAPVDVIVIDSVQRPTPD